MYQAIIVALKITKYQNY